MNDTYMVPITKEEKEALLERYPNLSIARTMRGDSQRHHYYCEERPNAMATLKRIRAQDVSYDAAPAQRETKRRRR